VLGLGLDLVSVGKLICTRIFATLVCNCRTALRTGGAVSLAN